MVQNQCWSAANDGASDEEDRLIVHSVVALVLVAATASDAAGCAGMAFVLVGLAVEAAASGRAAGGAGAAASERVRAGNGLMGGVSAVAIDAAATWEVDGFVGICLGIVRLLIGGWRRWWRWMNLLLSGLSRSILVEPFLYVTHFLQ